MLLPTSSQSQCEVTIDGYQRCNMDLLEFEGTTNHSIAPANKGRFYFDVVLGVFRCSQDGGSYFNCFGGGSGGHTIQDEGAALTQRTNLNFVGTAVTVTDDAGNDATVVTISGTGGGGSCWEEDGNADLQPVSSSCTDTFWEEDGNGDLQPQA